MNGLRLVLMTGLRVTDAPSPSPPRLVEAIASSFEDPYRESPTFRRLADYQGVIVETPGEVRTAGRWRSRRWWCELHEFHELDTKSTEDVWQADPNAGSASPR